MELATMIVELSSLPGPSGQEDFVREDICAKLEPLCDEVWKDAMGNLIGVKRCGKSQVKKLLLDAHMDEVGLIVTGIERGFLRFSPLGGIDARILPATGVRVLTDSPIYGVIDTMPPHALSASDMDKSVPVDQLVIDIGMTQQEAENAVPLGTPVSFYVWPVRLGESRMCGKSLDNRASAGILLKVMENLKDAELDMDVYCMFSVQEELGVRGAAPGVYGIDPDYALVLDVTHAKTHDARSTGLMEMGGGPAIGIGPNMTRTMTEALVDIAKENNIPYQMEVMSGSSGTNAWQIQIARGGIATGVVSLPLKYMHTPHEVIDLQDAALVERLVTAFVKQAGEVLK